MRIVLLLFLASFLVPSQAKPLSTMIFRAPAGARYAQVVPGGETVLPNGRILTPSGRRLYTGEDLWKVLYSPDGRYVVGFHDGGLSIYDLTAGDGKRQVLSRKEIAPAGVFSQDGKELYISTGDNGEVEVIRVADWSSQGLVSVKGDRKSMPYLNDLVLSEDGQTLYGADIAHQEIVSIDLAGRKMLTRTGAGRQPYALASSQDRLFVANIGIFDYSVLDLPKAGQGNPRGLSRPAFAFPTRESEFGTEREGRRIPGIGSPYVPEAQSVWSYRMGGFGQLSVDRRQKAGVLIHAAADGGKAVGASAPNALLLRDDRLYVSNANNDTVQVFEASTLKLLKTFKLTPVKELAKLRGVIPSGMAMNEASDRLYVCESGLNSVVVLNPESGAVLGRIPTGWFPMQIALSPDESTLAVATQKGIGRGPRGRLHPRKDGDERFGFTDMPGMIQLVEDLSMNALNFGNEAVLRNNGLVPTKQEAQESPIPQVPGQKSKQIEYVVFITKENHTFDGIFGELKSRGAVGEPEYAEFGTRGWIEERGKDERLPIMPNHIRLANRFSISDNFYMEPQASGDGHRWLVGVYPSLWTTRVFYAGWDYRRTNEAKGRLVSFGSDGSQIPEDYLENGSMWEHLGRHGITFRNYGEGYELPATDEGWMTNRAGTYYQTNYPMPKILWDNTDFDFPAYNNNIPDIARADWFVEDIEQYRKKNRGKLPKFINIAICNDHGAGANAARGYPYVASYMADNDLALGRIVEYLSRQPEWKKMAIFVTQDDSGGDDDSVDRHRSFVVAISPYAKKGHISKDHSSIMSIIKTIYSIFGIGPNNMFDAVATPLTDMFTMKPDFTPYTHVLSDPRVFDPLKTFDPFDPKFERRRREGAKVRMDDPEFVEGLRERGKKLGG